MAAKYIIPTQKVGTDLKPITITSSTPMTGGSICANFKTGYNATTAFAPAFTIAEDGLSATSATLPLNFKDGRYFSDFTIIYADGKKLPIGQYNITLEDSTC